jgi:hypothetical protein
MTTENKVKKYDTLAIKSDDMALYSELFSSMLDMEYTEREGSYLGEHNTFDFDNNGKIDIIQNIEGEEQYDEDLKDYGLYVHVSNIVEQDKFIKKALKNKDVTHISRHVYSSDKIYTYKFDEESDEFSLLSEELR